MWAFCVCASVNKKCWETVSHMQVWIKGQAWDYQVVLCVLGEKSQPLYERPHFPPLTTLFSSIADAGLHC